MDTTKNAIEVTNLVKRYKELVAHDHINLTVKPGNRLRKNHNYKLHTFPAHIR
mgnify:CR=1 FL=1